MSGQGLSAEDAESLRLALDLSYGLVERLTHTDFSQYETMDADDAVTQMLEGPVRQLLRSLRTGGKLLTFLPREEAAMHESQGDDKPGPKSMPARAVEGRPRPNKDRFLEELDATMARLAADPHSKDEEFGAVCTYVSDELGALQIRLKAAETGRSKWALIAEGEEARHKAIKALKVGITLAGRMLGPSATLHDLPAGKTELQVALELRATLVPIARKLVEGCQRVKDSPEVAEALEVIRAARVAVSNLFGSPLYQYIRTQDRHQMQSVRQSVDAWMDGAHELDAALTLLGRLEELANTFLGLNTRKLLVEHDDGVRQEALAQLGQLREGGGTALPWPEIHKTLGRLRFRDAELDAAMAQTTAEALPQGPLLTRIDAALRAL